MPKILESRYDIFTILNTMGVPWADLNITQELYIDYMCNISGEKIISNLLEKVVDGDTITQGELTVIMRLVYSMYGDKWNRLWNALQLEYNPVYNYNMVENMTDDTTEYNHGKTTTRTNDTSYTKEGTDTETTTDYTEETTNDLAHTKTGTETTDPGSSKTENNSVYGFNSADAVPVAGKETTFTGEDTTTYDLTDADTGTSTKVVNGAVTTEYDTEEKNTGTITDVDSGTDTQTRNYELTRVGNIGVTTTQQMLESEISLRQLHDYFRSIVYPDLDRVLTIEIY